MNINNYLKSRAKELRRNMTIAERALWKILRRKQLDCKFRRQQPVGDYIVDFVCFEKKLIVEVDGGQHFGSEKDVERTNWLENEGFKVVRFWNNEIIRNVEGVYSKIVKKNSPSPSPSPQGRGE